MVEELFAGYYSLNANPVSCDIVIQLYFFQSLTTIKQRLAQFRRAFIVAFFSASIPAKDISSIFSTLAGTRFLLFIGFQKGFVFHRLLL